MVGQPYPFHHSKPVVQSRIAPAMNFLEFDKLAGEHSDRAELLVIGTWALDLHVYSLPNMVKITSHPLGGDVMARR